MRRKSTKKNDHTDHETQQSVSRYVYVSSTYNTYILATYSLPILIKKTFLFHLLEEQYLSKNKRLD